MLSSIAEKVFVLLKELFPHIRIETEHFVVYRGQKLFVDFYLPSYGIAIEVHGQQHDKFVQHFHGDEYGWRKHKRRDKLKEEWAEVNKVHFVVIRDGEIPKTKEELLNLIRSA